MRDASLISTNREYADFVSDVMTAVLEFHYHHMGTRLQGNSLKTQVRDVLLECLNQGAVGAEIHTVVDRLLGP